MKIVCPLCSPVACRHAIFIVFGAERVEGAKGRGTTYFAESHYVRKNFTNPRCTVVVAVVVVVGQGFWTGRVIKGMKCTESNYANENL